MCPNHELLSAWLDNEVPSPWKESLDSHINSCKSCKTVITEMEAIRKAFVVEQSGIDATAEKARLVCYEKLEPLLLNTRITKLRTGRLLIPAPVVAAALVVFAILGFAFFDLRHKNTELRMAVLRAQEAGSLISSGLGIETVIDFVSRQSGSVNININLPPEAFGSSAGEPFIIREADYKAANQAGSRR